MRTFLGPTAFLGLATLLGCSHGDAGGDSAGSGAMGTATATDGGGRTIVLPDGAVEALGGDGDDDSGTPRTGGGAPTVDGGAGYVGGVKAASGPANAPCTSVTNAAGTTIDFPWGPGTPNVANFARESDTVHFHWSAGMTYDVLQGPGFDGQAAPLGKFADAMWPTEIRSGSKTDGGTFDWNIGSYPCGYRPGIYYFVSQDDPTLGPISISYTVPSNGQLNNADYATPKACNTLGQTDVYGGRYAALADRSCSVYEVNNFQTDAHFDWVPPIMTAVQGDLVMFRWTSVHNAVQVHDAYQDTPIAGGYRSGDKSNCVGGPGYNCANGEPSLGESVLDTANWRPGIVHISDENIFTCPPPHMACTGMGMEIFLTTGKTTPTVTPGGCCAIDRKKGQACNLIDVWNDQEGSQFPYLFTANRGDLVRFRWSGSLRIFEALPVDAATNDAPDPTRPMPNGLAMPSAVECLPGPNLSCLGGNTDEAEFIVDMDQAIGANLYSTEPYQATYMDFAALGENTSGYTSQDTRVHIAISNAAAYSSNPACP